MCVCVNSMKVRQQISFPTEEIEEWWSRRVKSMMFSKNIFNSGGDWEYAWQWCGSELFGYLEVLYWLQNLPRDLLGYFWNCFLRNITIEDTLWMFEIHMNYFSSESIFLTSCNQIYTQVAQWKLFYHVH